MKFSIAFIDSGIKKKPSKADRAQKASHLDSSKMWIAALEKTLRSFLIKNPHLKSVKEVTMTMTLCGRRKIQSLNRDFRQKDYATDVLSFPIFENLRPDKTSKERLPYQIELGDIVICKEVARKQAKEFEITFEQELIHLAVHGFLHLLGFDHEISLKEEKLMQEYEEKLVGKVYKAFRVN